MLSLRAFLIILVLTIFTSCASTGSHPASMTAQLSPGMSYDEVVALLGEPKASRTENENWIATWSLHDNHKGFVPYDMKFDQRQVLVSWSVNEAEYQKSRHRSNIVVIKSLNS